MRRYLLLLIVISILKVDCCYARWYDDVRYSPKNGEEISDNWTSMNTKMELTHIALSLIDWRQTRYAMKHQDIYKENNPLVRENLSPDTVDAWFAGYFFVHLGISYILPSDLRAAWQLVTVIRKAGNVYRNYYVGIKFGF